MRIALRKTEDIKIMMKTENTFLLASKSPRRIELLGGIGVNFDVRPADIDESAHVKDTPAETAEAITLAKVMAAAETDGGEHRFIIAADTLVEAANGEILGKPTDKADAERMIRLLSGTRHYVHTGIAVADTSVSPAKIASAVETTAVIFLPLDDGEIDAYVNSDEPFDKAGGYGIQERGGLFVKGIEGDYFNVMGLPLCRLNLLMRENFGVQL